MTSPWGRPIPPSPGGSKAILDRSAERNTTFRKETLVTSIVPSTKLAQTANGESISYDLFLGIPKHRVPEAEAASPLAENGRIPVDKATLATRFPDVVAVGDVTSVGTPVGTPKAGVFSQNAAKIVATQIIAGIKGGEMPGPYGGTGTCYVEWGDDRVARLEADFFGGPSPVAPLIEPSLDGAQAKKEFASSRFQRWFGHTR